MNPTPKLRDSLPFMAIFASIVAICCIMLYFLDVSAREGEVARLSALAGAKLSGAESKGLTVGKTAIRTGDRRFMYLLPIERSKKTVEYAAIVDVPALGSPSSAPTSLFVRMGTDGTVKDCTFLDRQSGLSLAIPRREADMLESLVGKGGSAPLSSDIRYAGRDSVNAVAGATFTFNSVVETLRTLSARIKELK